MKPRTPFADPVVLVSWVSVGHAAAPFLDVLGHKASPLFRRVQKLYLCWRQTRSENGKREKDVLGETQRTLRKELGVRCPELLAVPWKTQASPIDHGEILPFAEDVLRRVREENPEATIVIHLSPGTPAMHAVWLTLGSTSFISGPVRLIQGLKKGDRTAKASPVVEVEVSLDSWLQRFRASRPERAEDLDDGQLWDPAAIRSPALRGVLEKIERWAPLPAPVLLTGERGVGKTTLANLIRARSPFQKQGGGAWPSVVCGQFRVNPQLARSELFGHKKGAFSGASEDRKGLLEAADGDTLFLDEVADIDRDTQRLLMAALEGRGFRRIGENTVRHSSFRLVCATNRPLGQLRSECLDPDFFDRIGVFIIEVPPLRSCREDLPLFWKQSLRKAAAQVGVGKELRTSVSSADRILEELSARPLTGNLRDLQRLALHILAALKASDEHGRAIEKAFAELDALSEQEDASTAPLTMRLPLAGGLKAELEAHEALWLKVAMAWSRGNQSEAASLLGMNRRTFADRWTRLGGNNA